MKPKFKNQSVKLMYQLYQEFDHGESNDALDGYRSKLSQSELSCNHILFSYVDTLLEDSALDLTYATLSELPNVLDDQYKTLSMKYLAPKNKDQIVKLLAAYLTVLALNMHDLDLTCTSSHEKMSWGTHYKIAINDYDLLPALDAAASFDGENLTIDHKSLNDAYNHLTFVSLSDYFAPLYLEKKGN